MTPKLEGVNSKLNLQKKIQGASQAKFYNLTYIFFIYQKIWEKGEGGENERPPKRLFHH